MTHRSGLGKKRGGTLLLGACAWLTLAALGVACGSNGASGAGGTAGASVNGDAGANNGGTSDTGSGGTAGSSSTRGGRNGGGGASSGATGPGGETGLAGEGGQSNAGLDPGSDGPGYDGVDLAAIAKIKDVPSGCNGGFDSAAGTLELDLDAKVPTVIVSVTSGIVSANGTPCSAADGAPAVAEDISTLSVKGSAADETLIIDGAAAFGSKLLSAAGDISVDLGDGTDRLTVLGSAQADTISLGSSGAQTVVDFSGDAEPDIHATSIESVLVSAGPKPDVVAADGRALGIDPLAIPALLYGDGANDSLLGGAANDELHGGIGNDTLLAGSEAGGADIYDGGAGEDVVDYSARAAGVRVTMASGADDGEPGENDDVQATVEDLVGGQGANDITGSAVGNRLWGGPAADTIRGGDGDDFIYGGAGDDLLDGQNGDDYLYGEAGNDTLLGGPGDDLLDGYPGTNTIDGGDGDGDICLKMPADTASHCEL